jgi:hypothetical protein
MEPPDWEATTLALSLGVNCSASGLAAGAASVSWLSCGSRIEVSDGSRAVVTDGSGAVVATLGAACRTGGGERDLDPLHATLLGPRCPTSRLT